MVTLFAILSIRRDVSAVIDYNYQSDEYQICLPEEARSYLEKIKTDVIQLIDCYSYEFNIEKYDLSDISFEKEFVIYDPERKYQEQKYYVPVSCAEDTALMICLYNI